MPARLTVRTRAAVTAAALATAALSLAAAPASAAAVPLSEVTCGTPGEMEFHSGPFGWSRCFFGVGDLDAPFHPFAKPEVFKSFDHAGWFTYENKRGALKTQRFEKNKTYTGEFTTLKHIHVDG